MCGAAALPAPPVVAPPTPPVVAADDALASIVAMGFTQLNAQAALSANGGDVERAVAWLMDDGEADEPPARRQRVDDAPPPAAPPPAPPPRAARPRHRRRRRRAPLTRAAATPRAAPRRRPRRARAGTWAHPAPARATGNDHGRALKRLMIELGKMRRGENDGKYEAEPLDEADVFVWRLKLLAYDPKSADPAEAALGKDLKARGMDGLELRMIFEDGPGGYPCKPPFVHMVRPRLRGGYVLDGGGICMETLTPDGWSPATSIHALATSVRAMMLTGHPRLATTSKAAREPEYSLEGARRDFASLVKIHKRHGWSDGHGCVNRKSCAR